ncbi:terpenoid synthase [Trametes versicolor FP-101664 SS1]|uniref:terpenoid synthase n=1 Tax=Trametes versicolor (strain FP-101664) TaxID=717944 RepID=UPI0004623236|nr:terpenoid synthase [Trametes versicolor FP-101664 SS1]EIW61324.1 terpenoid synthase [Trametes versicolor FP-101664 SS1]
MSLPKILVIQETIRDLLHRCAYRSPKSETDHALRRELAEEVAKWDTDLPPAAIGKLVHASCSVVETMYGHTPAAHRGYIGLYTACIIYADDVGEQDPDALKLFTQRFARSEPQPNAVFECLAGLLRQAYDLWPQFGADCIISGTLDAISANYIECTTHEMRAKPLATCYPTYLRQRASFGPAFTSFMFPNTWRATPESYIQILPDIESWTLGVNDILSFYKEELAGEDNNYIHLRAAAEQVPTDKVLRNLVEEVSNTTLRVGKVVADDAELSKMWSRYMLCSLEFHLKTRRYRLDELGFTA